MDIWKVSDALYWKHQANFKAVEQPDGRVTIERWDCPGVSKPTKAQIAAIVAEYDQREMPNISVRAELTQTENPKDLARKIEDLYDHILNGVPLPVNPDTGKTYASEWLEARKETRARLVK